jgi:hypothetical protein
LGLFEDIETASPEMKSFVLVFSGTALLFCIPAALGFLWWAGGALARYSLWQQSNLRGWRWFWFGVLLFYGMVVLDPLDRVHPSMSRRGLAPAPNIVELFNGKYETFQFQWGYFLLWLLFWFLVVALHWSYILHGLHIVWFYTKRFHRYTASLLAGFRETLATAALAPVTVQAARYDSLRPPLAHSVPRQRPQRLTPEQARAIIAADLSGAICLAPGQDAVLFVDLGRFAFDPALLELADEAGEPLLEYCPFYAAPGAARQQLLVPLKHPPAPAAAAREVRQ